MNSGFDWAVLQSTRIGSVEVEILRRDIRLTTEELRSDTEPFTVVETLLEYKNAVGERVLRKGVVRDVSIRDHGLSLSFHPVDSGMIEMFLNGVEKVSLTVWRMNNRLDSLQVGISSIAGYLYLQTGGDGILGLSNGQEMTEDLQQILSIFNDSLTPLRTP